MMDERTRRLEKLLESNREWAEKTTAADPDFFSNLAGLQEPEYLWIGCSDSRVPANQITGLKPGEVFVHRNIANVVEHTDLNVLSVLQYSVDVLAVKHIIVCGHYGCGGVKAAMDNRSFGLLDNWIRRIKDVYQYNHAQLAALPDDQARFDRLCELNVQTQVAHVCHTSIVQEAWNRGQDLAVHAWIYGIDDGRIRDLDINVCEPDQVPEIYQIA